MKVIKPKPEQKIWAREFEELTGAKHVPSERWNATRFEFPCGAVAEWRWQDTTPEHAAQEARGAGFCEHKKKTWVACPNLGCCLSRGHNNECDMRGWWDKENIEWEAVVWEDDY